MQAPLSGGTLTYIETKALKGLITRSLTITDITAIHFIEAGEE